MPHPAKPTPQIVIPDSSFVGRDTELQSLLQALQSDARLITIVGSAGIGKTRLALHCAAALSERLGSRADVRICELSAASTADDICDVVARAVDAPLDVTSAAEESAAELGRYLAAINRSLYIVLDNFEQIASFAAFTVGTWLSLAPNVCLLVTSRERLRLAEEVCFELSPLSLPSADACDPEEIAQSDAVQLFVERARRTRANFTLAEDPHAVAEIVRRVDGIPMAVELCAARMSTFHPRQLSDRLEMSLKACGQNLRRREARHSTLWRAIDWSWDLLGEAEQVALAQCSAFRGGFDLDAAIAVIRCAPASVSSAEHGDERESIVRIIELLRDKSLLVAQQKHLLDDAPSQTMRFGLLEGVREYAEARLSDLGIADEVHERHAEHYLSLGEALIPQVNVAAAHLARAMLNLEAENLVAAGDRALASRNGPRALRAALVLEPVRLHAPRSRLDPYVRLLEGALDLTNGRGDLASERSQVLVAHGLADGLRGKFMAAAGWYIEAVSEAKLGNDARSEILALTALGLVSGQTSQTDISQRFFDDASDLLERHPNARLQGLWNLARSGAHIWNAEPAAAKTCAERAVEAFRCADDPQHEGMAYGQIGLSQLNLGDAKAAERQARRGLHCSRRLGDYRSQGYIQACHGRALQALGRFDDAEQAIKASIHVHRASGDKWSHGLVEGFLGSLYFERGQLDEALTSFRRACMLYQSLASARDVGTAASVQIRYHSIYRARLAAALAAHGDLSAAEEEWDDAVALGSEGQTKPAAEGIRIHGAHLELARARRAEAEGRPVDAAAHRQRVEEVLHDVDPALFATSEDYRIALRLLRADRGRWQSAPESSTQRPDWNVATQQLGDAFRIGPEARWFQRGPDQRVELLKARAARLILRCLVDQRLADPGRALPLHQLFEAGWPGEQIAERSAKNRVYVTLTKLRKLGLNGMLQSRDDGFLLDPQIRIEPASEL